MAISLNTSYASLITQSNLTKTNNALAISQQRLSTGMRINSAADDAAGLQIATRLNAQGRGMAAAMRNTADATSLLQTADGAMTEITDIVQRMKDLATLGANSTYTADDRKAMQAEYDDLGKEVANIVKNTKFAGEGLFSNGTSIDGTGGKFVAEVFFQIGSSQGEVMSFQVGGGTAGTPGASLTDFLEKMVDVSKSFEDGSEGSEIIAATAATGVANIKNLTDTLDLIGTLRSTFGASINRLNHTSNNLANMRDNTEAARLNIMSTDYALESANMTQNSMKMQAGISMLKQSGQMSGLAMSLLG